MSGFNKPSCTVAAVDGQLNNVLAESEAEFTSATHSSIFGPVQQVVAQHGGVALRVGHALCRTGARFCRRCRRRPARTRGRWQCRPRPASPVRRSLCRCSMWSASEVGNTLEYHETGIFSSSAGALKGVRMPSLQAHPEAQARAAGHARPYLLPTKRGRPAALYMSSAASCASSSASMAARGSGRPCRYPRFPGLGAASRVHAGDHGHLYRPRPGA